MDNKIKNEVGIAILLREFCDQCAEKENCSDWQKCNAVKFAQYIIDKGFEKVISS